MNHLKAISIKFVYVTLIILSLFGIFSETPLTNLLLLSILTTVITFVVGDIIVYPWAGNILTTIFDFGLAFFTLFLLGRFLLEPSFAMVLTSLGGAFFIMCIEPLFHAYMTERVFAKAEEYSFQTNDRHGKITQLHPQYMTEFAEEKEPPEEKDNGEK